jgi:hypothetical protein
MLLQRLDSFISQQALHVPRSTWMLALPHLMLLLDLDAGPMGHAQTGRTTRTGNEQQADGRRLHVLPANTRKDSQSREEKES